MTHIGSCFCGAVEIEVEHAAPAVLVLRAAGKLLNRPREAKR